MVIDQDGQPISGAKIESFHTNRYEFRWPGEPPMWGGAETNWTTTAADGTYTLVLAPGTHVARVTAGSHELLWVNLLTLTGYLRRLDVQIDRTLPAGITNVINVGRQSIALAPECEWTCSADRAPPPTGWWSGGGGVACPAGTRLTYERERFRVFVEVSCQTPYGVRHGPYSGWGASEINGWYQRGEKCGKWRTVAPGYDAPPSATNEPNPTAVGSGPVNK